VLGPGCSCGAFSCGALSCGALSCGALSCGGVMGAVDVGEDAAGDADRPGVRTTVEGGDAINVLAAAFDAIEVVATSGVIAGVDPQAARMKISAPAWTPRANGDLAGRAPLAPAVSGMTHPVSIVVEGRRRVPWWPGPGGEYSSDRSTAAAGGIPSVSPA